MFANIKETNSFITRLENNDQTLTFLPLWDNHRFQDAMKLLENNMSVTHLSINHCNLSSDDVNSMVNTILINKTINHYSISPSNISEYLYNKIISSFETNTVIRDLHIGQLYKDNFFTLCNMLKNNRSIVNLWIQDAKMSREEYSLLFDALNDTSNGTPNSVKYLMIQSCEIDQYFCHLFGNFIKNNSTLEVVILNNINTNDEDIYGLSQGLEHNSTLKRFFLNGKIGDDGVEVFADMLKGNLTLECLGLGNNITCVGVEKLANAIKQNPSLKRLSLENNFIGSNGFQKLLECSNLRKIWIRQNKITDDGISAFMNTENNLEELVISYNMEITEKKIEELFRSLHDNKTLKRIDVSTSNWAIGNNCIKALADLIKYNKILTSISIGNSEIDKKTLQYLTDALETNHTIINLDIYYYPPFNRSASALRYTSIENLIERNKNWII